MVWFCGLCSHSRGALNCNSGKVHRRKICLSHQINSVSFIHVHKNPNTILLDGHTLNLLFSSLKISQYVFSSVLSRVFAELPLKNPEANFYKKKFNGQLCPWHASFSRQSFFGSTDYSGIKSSKTSSFLRKRLLACHTQHGTGLCNNI